MPDSWGVHEIFYVLFFVSAKVNHGSISDTLKISQSFSQISRSEIPVILSSIQGPYAFIYLDIKKQRLYFGRDRLGRHSLLWSSDCEGGLVLTSVGKRNVLDFKEIPAIGIFMVDMNSSGKSAVDLVFIFFTPV
jgi:asparagine synthetase B (glutamine-hydrolysing)